MAFFGLRAKIFMAISPTALASSGMFETFYKIFISKLLQLFEIILEKCSLFINKWLLKFILKYGSSITYLFCKILFPTL